MRGGDTPQSCTLRTVHPRQTGEPPYRQLSRSDVTVVQFTLHSYSNIILYLILANSNDATVIHLTTRMALRTYSRVDIDAHRTAPALSLASATTS